MFGLGMQEMVIIMVIAVLLFGKRLPEVARSMGKGVVEFKKGIRGIEEQTEQIDQYAQRAAYEEPDDYQEASAPKFEPPPE